MARLVRLNILVRGQVLEGTDGKDDHITIILIIFLEHEHVKLINQHLSSWKAQLIFLGLPILAILALALSSFAGFFFSLADDSMLIIDMQT